MNSETNLYITHTQYHVILSLLIAADRPIETNYIAVNPYYDPNTVNRIRSLLEEELSLFDNVIILDEGEYSTPGFNRDGIRSLPDAKRLRSFTKCNNIDRVFTFGDKKIVDQASLQVVSKSGGECIYVEDGLGAYLNYSNKSLSESSTSPIKKGVKKVQDEGISSFIKHAYYFTNSKIVKSVYYKRPLLRAKLGFWYDDEGPYGTSTFIDRAFLSFPDLARPELNKIPKEKIPKENINSEYFTSFIQLYIKNTEEFTKDLYSIDAMLIVPHKKYLDKNSRVKERLEMKHKELVDNGLVVGLKRHPRDSEELNWNGGESIDIPDMIPAEIFYGALGEQLTTIFGFPTTAMYTARWFNKSANISCFTESDSMQQYSNQHINMLRRMGIEAICIS